MYEINFEIDNSAVQIFNSNLSIDNLLLQLTSYKPNIPVESKKTLLFFDEVQKYPQILTSLKSFALDKRFHVIASGSMMGVFMNEVSSFPVGYVNSLYMKPMTFEEFLWANGYSEEYINTIKNFFINETSVPELTHQTLNNLFLQYIVVGGMPEVVKEYIETKDIRKTILKQKTILLDYEKDIAKYASKNTKEKIRECYESIPDQLAKDNKKYQFKVVKPGGTSRYFANSLQWINDVGLINKVYRLKTFDLPFRSYRDTSSFKLYYFDTGLLLSMYSENVHHKILNKDLGVFKGGIFENVIAQILISNNMSLYYYRRDDRLEVAFITYYKDRIIPIEVKSSKNTKSVSLNNLIEREELSYGIKLSLNNVNCTNDRYKCFPLYMTMFIKNDD